MNFFTTVSDEEVLDDSRNIYLIEIYNVLPFQSYTLFPKRNATFLKLPSFLARNVGQ